MRQGTCGFYQCVPNFTPTCFGKWLLSSGDRMCLISYSSNVCVCAETCLGKIWNTLIKSTNSLTHLSVILQRYYKTLGPTIKMTLWSCYWQHWAFLMQWLILNKMPSWLLEMTYDQPEISTRSVWPAHNLRFRPQVWSIMFVYARANIIIIVIIIIIIII
jgi:hypothetical protein